MKRQAKANTLQVMFTLNPNPNSVSTTEQRYLKSRVPAIQALGLSTVGNLQQRRMKRQAKANTLQVMQVQRGDGGAKLYLLLVEKELALRANVRIRERDKEAECYLFRLHFLGEKLLAHVRAAGVNGAYHTRAHSCGCRARTR